MEEQYLEQTRKNIENMKRSMLEMQYLEQTSKYIENMERSMLEEQYLEQTRKNIENMKRSMLEEQYLEQTRKNIENMETSMLEEVKANLGKVADDQKRKVIENMTRSMLEEMKANLGKIFGDEKKDESLQEVRPVISPPPHTSGSVSSASSESHDSDFESIEATLENAKYNPSAHGFELVMARNKLLGLLSRHGREARFLSARACVFVGLGQWTDAHDEFVKLERDHPGSEYTSRARNAWLRAASSGRIPRALRDRYRVGPSESGLYNQFQDNIRDSNSRREEWGRQDNTYDFNRWMNRDQ